MSILRKAARRLSHSLRFYCTQPVMADSFDPTAKQEKKLRRVAPIKTLQSDNFKISQWLTSNRAMSGEDWAEARDEILSTEKLRMDKHKVDMLIVNFCLEMQRSDSAMAYLEYLWEGHDSMNISAMITYLKLCYLKTEELNDKEKKYLNDIYDAIREKHPVVDAFTGECCVLGVSKTERWKEAVEILQEIKVACNPRKSTYSALISAAFNNDEPEIGWKYLIEAVTNFPFDNQVYTNYLEYCKRGFTGEQLEHQVGKMFEFWGNYDIRPFVDVIEAYERVFHDLGWSTERTSIRDVGICRSCSGRLHSLIISDDEFQRLTRLVYDRVIVGDDIYRKTSPRELKHFVTFVQQNKPWDIVIDGLNVAYLTNSANKMNGQLVTTTVKLCLEMGKKVLVLGRKHMSHWPNFDLTYIKHKAHIFLADNGSADDPYLLYATLVCGPRTTFVSRDLMRQHKFLLDDPIITRIFKHWQMTHQYLPTAVRSRSGRLEMRLKHPPKYLPVVQKNECGWHVPFTFDSHSQPFTDYEPPKSWVCFRKNRPSASIVCPSGT